jgi:hypothetical protein
MSSHINKDELYMQEFVIFIYMMQSFAYTLIYASNILKRKKYLHLFEWINKV